MHERILDIKFLHPEDFERIWWDAGTPPLDRTEVRAALQTLVDAFDPRELLTPVAEHSMLVEFVVTSRSSGHRYGMMFIDLGHGVVSSTRTWSDTRSTPGDSPTGGNR